MCVFEGVLYLLPPLLSHSSYLPLREKRPRGGHGSITGTCLTLTQRGGGGGGGGVSVWERECVWVCVCIEHSRYMQSMVSECVCVDQCVCVVFQSERLCVRVRLHLHALSP